MIKSKHFWIAAVLIASIPLLSIDIIFHFLDWKKEVREEIITLVHDSYFFAKNQKTEILDRVFQRNQELTLLVASKILACIIFLVAAIFFLRKYKKQQATGFLRSAITVFFTAVFFLVVKFFIFSRINRNEKIIFLSLPAAENSLQKLYAENFKGKVVYVDFWGTTCGPCLEEFRNFTKPLKEKYKGRSDLGYLYISQGNRFIWRKQIDKYNIEGHHVFLSGEQYSKLYSASTKDSTVLMPRYLIIDKTGEIAATMAHQPSDRDSLYLQLDKYLD